MRRLGDVPRNVRRLPAAFATLERHLAMGVRPQGRHKAPPGTPLDGLMPARRTGQTLLVPVSQDQLKRLGGAVFLDRSASHLEPPASDGGQMYTGARVARKPSTLTAGVPAGSLGPPDPLERPMTEPIKSSDYIPV